MKNHIIPIALIALFAISCESNTDTENTDLESRRDLLAHKIDSLTDLLVEIEKEITANDTNSTKTVVTAYQALSGRFEHYVEIYGTLEADKNSSITAETQGTITTIHVREGQEVKKGTLLLEIDGSILQNNIRETKTQLEFAETVFKKQERLWKQSIGSELQYLESKNNVENLRSRLNTLESQYAQTRVKAPFDGVIDEVFVKIGQLASPQQPLLRIVNLDKVYLNADVSERYIRNIRKGSKARLEFPSLDLEVETSVDQTGNFINPANRTFRVVFRLENSNKLFKPNLMANVFILDYDKDSIVSIPNRLIQQDPAGNSYVYVAAMNSSDIAEVEKRVVSIGKTYRAITEIIEGLEAGEYVVDKGSRSIKSGQRVMITEISSKDNNNG